MTAKYAHGALGSLFAVLALATVVLADAPSDRACDAAMVVAGAPVRSDATTGTTDPWG